MENFSNLFISQSFAEEMIRLSSVFEAQSLTNRGKAFGIFSIFAQGLSLGQNFPDNPSNLFNVCHRTKRFCSVTLPQRCNSYVSQVSQNGNFRFCDTWLTLELHPYYQSVTEQKLFVLWDNLWERRGCSMVNGAERENPRWQGSIAIRKFMSNPEIFCVTLQKNNNIFVYNEKFPDTPRKFLAIHKIFVSVDNKNYIIFILHKKNSGQMLEISVHGPEVFSNLEMI